MIIWWLSEVRSVILFSWLGRVENVSACAFVNVRVCVRICWERRCWCAEHILSLLPPWQLSPGEAGGRWGIIVVAVWLWSSVYTAVSESAGNDFCTVATLQPWWCLPRCGCPVPFLFISLHRELIVSTITLNESWLRSVFASVNISLDTVSYLISSYFCNSVAHPTFCVSDGN